MTETETRQLSLAIINQAQEQNLLKFQLIKTWREFWHYYLLSRSTKLVIKTLKVSADRLFKKYCKDVTTGISDFTKLLAWDRLQDIIAFYETDLATLRKMLDEYDRYLGEGNFWYAFLGGKRAA